ncbi:MAG: HNH endonuclease [Planctomycetes bacterium]|nr:HNH endonuclease [Planctomycetota bacterium]
MKSENHERQKVAEETEAKLMVESRRICNLCWQRNAEHVHHIVSVAEGGDNSEDNLMLLCTSCHSEVHTTHTMSRNVAPATLRLYKETWLDLVRRYPLLPQDIRQRENDVDIIRGILRQADRRAMYFPLNVEVGYQMFKSLQDLRIYIQSSGYRLLHDDAAKNHVREIYKALVELELIDPGRGDEAYCLYGALGRNRIDYLELRRKTLRFHLNELARMVGHAEGLFTEDEFQRMGLDIVPPRSAENAPPCFRRYSARNRLCRRCEFAEECREATESAPR